MRDSPELTDPPSHSADTNLQTSLANADGRNKNPQQIITQSMAEQIPEASPDHVPLVQQVSQVLPVANADSHPVVSDPPTKDSSKGTETKAERDPILLSQNFGMTLMTVLRPEKRISLRITSWL